MKVIESSALQFSLDEKSGIFNIQSRDDRLPVLKGCHISIRGRKADQRHFYVNFNQLTEYKSSSGLNSIGKTITYQGIDEDLGISWRLNVNLPDGRPLALWQVELVNRSTQPVFIDQINILEPVKQNSQNIFFVQETEASSLAFHSNGWQSWSFTATYRPDQRMRRSNLGFLLDPMVLNPGTPQFRQAGRFSADFYGMLVDRKERTGMLLGFLSQKNHFGSLVADLRGIPSVRLWANGDGARLDPGMTVKTDPAVCYAFHLDQPDPIGPFLDVVADEHGIRNVPASPAGWCSWYYYYENISEDIIRENLAQLKEAKDTLPVDLVQIDDGFEAQVGDWLEFNRKFPDGIEPLAQEIRSAGFTPGLWLAPFIVHPGSQLAADHPDWLLKSTKGKLVRVGFGWNTLTLALDLTVPEALDYACRVLDAAAHHWGFPYLKLDFLYAAALKGQYYDGTRTRAQVLRSGMEALRRTVGDEIFLLGCGAPLGSMLGLVQAMRISEDVSGSWKPKHFGVGFLFKNETHMPSARNSIQNILTRAPLHRRWWVNDPDCLLVRPDSDLNIHEVRSLAAAIGLTGGSVLLSDRMRDLPQERLEIAAALMPPIAERVQVLDWLDAETPVKLRLDLKGAAGEWHALAYFNWKDSPAEVSLRAADFHLPGKDYFVRSFWDQTVWQAESGKEIFKDSLPAHAVILLSVRKKIPSEPVYLGSNINISQGLEVSKWEYKKDRLKVTIFPKRDVSAVVDIALPHIPKSAQFDRQPIENLCIAGNIYRFHFDVFHHGELLVNY
jgi:alpha-galactosidase